MTMTILRPEFNGVYDVRRGAYVRRQGDKYAARQCAGHLAVILLSLIVGAIMLSTLFLEDWLENEFQAGIVASILNGLLVGVFTETFKRIAVILCDWEDHRTQEKYDNVLVAKSFGFQFINSYMTIFITAFIKPLDGQPFNPCPCVEFSGPKGCSEASMATNGDVTPAGCTCSRHDCQTPAGTLLLIIFVVGIFVNNTCEIAIPMLKAHIKRKLEEADNETPPDYEAAVAAGEMAPAEIEAKYDPYGPLEMFDDFSEVAIHYGYTVMFAFACPLVPALHVLNNFVEIRNDGLKMCSVYQRCEAQQADDLGIWSTIRRIMGGIALTTNAAYIFCIAYATSHRSLSYRFWGFFATEHAALLALCVTRLYVDFRPPALKQQMDIEAADRQMALQNQAHESLMLRCGNKLGTIMEHQQRRLWHNRASSTISPKAAASAEDPNGFTMFKEMVQTNPPMSGFTCT